MVVNCPGCGIALSVPDEAKGRQVRCTGCGHVFGVPADGAMPASAAPDQPPPTPFPQPPPAGFQGAPFAGPYPPEYGDEVYHESFNLQGVNHALRAYWGSWRPNRFPTAAAILLDIVTCTLFGLIYYGVKFGELPKASRRDFGAGMAIGLMFVPLFQLYWLFRFVLGLCDRINLQVRLRGRNDLLLPRPLAKATCILALAQAIVQLAYAVVFVIAVVAGAMQGNPETMIESLVPFILIVQLLATAIFIGYIVCREIFVGRMQTAINTMAAATIAIPGREAQAWQ